MLIAFNLLSFQVGWFTSILGAAKDMFWLGPLMVLMLFAVHLKLHGNVVREVTLGLTIMIIGFATDTLLTVLGIYTPKTFLFPTPYSPPWLILMWLNFSTLFNVSIRWLRSRHLLAAVLGGIGGALAYYGGGALGAMEFNQPLYRNILITALVWAGLTPFFFILSGFIEKKLKENQS